MIIFGSGQEIRALNLYKYEEMDVVVKEMRVNAIDFDPKNEYVYWIDGHAAIIRRSAMVDGKIIQIGFAQDILRLGKHKLFIIMLYLFSTDYFCDFISMHMQQQII
jgi:hypothetical protein